ncbi:MAG: YceI family protein [Bacteroidales bacterium]|jgi:polyisoprenoid-binding protein YceI|nr:YceI family protein [Bacteroidales bacterium]NLM92775.1 YceI family protein [Bacteroidales bacterium]
MSITKWASDPTHSEIQFKVKHLMITTVTGYFREFSVNAETQDQDFSTAKVNFEAKTASVDTNNEDRDKHLRSGDFFESDKFPAMKFNSTKMEKVDDDTFKLHGELTIKDVTKPVTLNVDFGGTMKDPWGNLKAGFSLNGKINRKDWNLNWNAALETGGVLVSEEVRIFCEVQLSVQA